MDRDEGEFGIAVEGTDAVAVFEAVFALVAARVPTLVVKVCIHFIVREEN